MRRPAPARAGRRPLALLDDHRPRRIEVAQCVPDARLELFLSAAGCPAPAEHRAGGWRAPPDRAPARPGRQACSSRSLPRPVRRPRGTQTRRQQRGDHRACEGPAAAGRCIAVPKPGQHRNQARLPRCPPRQCLDQRRHSLACPSLRARRARRCGAPPRPPRSRAAKGETCFVLGADEGAFRRRSGSAS